MQLSVLMAQSAPRDHMNIEHIYSEKPRGSLCAKANQSRSEYMKIKWALDGQIDDCSGKCERLGQWLKADRGFWIELNFPSPPSKSSPVSFFAHSPWQHLFDSTG